VGLVRGRGAQVSGRDVRRHINDRHLPDKAIDVIDEAGGAAAAEADRPARDHGHGRAHRGCRGTHRADSAKTVSSSDRDVLRNLERNLKLVIYGQDKAIETLASSIKMARSGPGR
jgi:ATP-dependent Clp protease ATP-binding subunit ClpA